MSDGLSSKQDSISDLATIRDGATAGSTAIQPDDNISELTNDAGYITGITSSDVTTALGFNPYNATNPSGYQTASQVSTAISNAQLWETDTGEGSIVSKSNKSQGGQATGDYAVAEGFGSDAKGDYSHAEGQMTTTNGSGAHAEGSGTTAQGNCAHAEGYETIAQNQSEHAEGQYNKSNKASTTFGNAGNTIHSVGIGTGTGSLEEQDRKNAFEIMQNGNVYMLNVGSYDGTNVSSASTIQTVINGKQDTISDLEIIRTGAGLGATALQSVPSEYVTDTELQAYHDNTKQNVTDNSLTTTAKTVVGAINEVNGLLAGLETILSEV